MEPRTNLHDLYPALHRPHRLHGDGSCSNLRECWGNLLHGNREYNGSPKLGGGVKTRAVWGNRRSRLQCQTNSHEGHLVGYHPAIGGLSVSGYDQEKWVEFYKSAVLELEQSLIAGRIADARAEIVKRIEALRNIPGLHGDERQAIEDALNNLGLLDREDAKHAAEEKRQAGE